MNTPTKGKISISRCHYGGETTGRESSPRPYRRIWRTQEDDTGNVLRTQLVYSH